jgi:TolB-like protein/tetratricopeptide (TPR) repeat protein
MIGETLGHFRLLEMIGAGGMGVVYRAHDERLDRDVALKVLPSGTLADEAVRKRFRMEALVLSRLNHPNIATVHDFHDQENAHFLVMELIPGETLDEKIQGAPLPEREVLRLGVQLALGLSAAHAEGVVHRDLKPGNVRITPDGRLKVLDFGLATLRRLEWNERADTTGLGESALVAGSPPYMAPEQLLGEVVDARSDIYGAGAVLYEMVTGRRPFAESHGPRLVDAVLHAPPVPPRDINGRLSPGLEAIVLKCLDKDPARRYQSARELLVDLERLSVPVTPVTRVQPRAQRNRTAWASLSVAAVTTLLIASGPAARGFFGGTVEGSPVRSLVVLPLENRSGDPGQDYFADGMTDALIADLSQIGSLRVISRTSSMRYKAARKTLPEIARELGVDAVVEGSVLRSKDAVRITAQLVHVPSDRNLWARTFEGDPEDVISLQREVARSVAREVDAKLTGSERARLQSPGPIDPEAHEAYLRGKHLYEFGDSESLRRALVYFETAVAKQPDYPLALVGLADAHVYLRVLTAEPGSVSPEQALARAQAALDQALRLDPQLADAHSSAAYARSVLAQDWAGAEAGFKRAIALNANLSRAHEEYAWLLAARGRTDEAAALMRQALRLDPLSPFTTAGIARILFYQGRLPEAIEAYERALELQPQLVPALDGLAMAQLVRGDTEAAIRSLSRALERSPESPLLLSDLAHVYARAGRREQAVATLARWEDATRSRFPRREQAAHVYGVLGDLDRAFPLLEKAVADRSPGAMWLRVDPRYDALRRDPRFQQFLARLQLQG